MYTPYASFVRMLLHRNDELLNNKKAVIKCVTYNLALNGLSMSDSMYWYNQDMRHMVCVTCNSRWVPHSNFELSVRERKLWSRIGIEKDEISFFIHINLIRKWNQEKTTSFYNLAVMSMHKISQNHKLQGTILNEPELVQQVWPWNKNEYTSSLK